MALLPCSKCLHTSSRPLLLISSLKGSMISFNPLSSTSPFFTRLFRNASSAFLKKNTHASPTSTSTSSFSSLTFLRAVSWFLGCLALSLSTSSTMFSTTLSRVGELGLDIFLVSKMEVWKSLGLGRLKDLVWI